MALLDDVRAVQEKAKRDAAARRLARWDEIREEGLARFQDRFGVTLGYMRQATKSDRVQTLDNGIQGVSRIHYLAEHEGFTFGYAGDERSRVWYVLRRCEDCGTLVPLGLFQGTLAEAVAGALDYYDHRSDHTCGGTVMRDLHAAIGTAASELGISRCELIDRLAAS